MPLCDTFVQSFISPPLNANEFNQVYGRGRGGVGALSWYIDLQLHVNGMKHHLAKWKLSFRCFRRHTVLGRGLEEPG